MKYKKLILTAVASLLLIVSSIAQTTIELREKLLFGLKGGMNLSNVYDAQGESFQADAKIGLAAGGFLAIPIGKYIGIQPEILFSQKGFKGTGSILGGKYDFTRTTNFIDIPILFAVKPLETLTLLAGPQFSYLMKKTDVFANGVTTIAQEQEFANDNLRKNILSFSIGLDINVEHINIGLRSCWDMQTNNGDGTSATPRYKNLWYQATIGYRFY